MTFTIPIKPLSINAATKGKHFPTPEKRQYERDMRLLLPKVRVQRTPYYRVAYDFHLKQFALTDGANLEKVLSDCLVARGILEDDRYIVEYRIRKFPSETDKIVVSIEGCDLE